MNPGEISHFHKVASDEVWNLYQGIGLNLYVWDGTRLPPQRISLSADNNCFCYVIHAGIWQAAEATSEKVLMGCSVAPGFEFSDFLLMNRNSEEAKRLVSVAPEMTKYVAP